MIHPYLEIEDKRYLVKGMQIGVGRSADNDVILSHSFLSRNHARIVRAGGLYYLWDMGSSNGTWCNGERVDRDTPTVLRGRESIRFGEVEARFLIELPDEGATLL